MPIMHLSMHCPTHPHDENYIDGDKLCAPNDRILSTSHRMVKKWTVDCEANPCIPPKGIGWGFDSVICPRGGTLSILKS